jgi:hypothetical protein
LSTVANSHPSSRTRHTRHQNRSPRIPTLTRVPLWTQGLGTFLSLVSNVCARSSSAAVAMRDDTPRETHASPPRPPPCFRLCTVDAHDMRHTRPVWV